MGRNEWNGDLRKGNRGRSDEFMGVRRRGVFRKTLGCWLLSFAETESLILECLPSFWR